MVQSLFGSMLSPEAQQQALINQRANEFAKMGVAEQLGSMGYKAGASLGGGLAKAFGVDVTDPTINAATELRSLASQYDTTTSDGLLKMAIAIKDKNPDMALKIAQKAQELKFEEAKLNKETALGAKATQDTTILANKTKREATLQKALSELPDTATDEDIKNVVLKYGSPDTILKGLEIKQQKEADRTAKEILNKERAEAKVLAAEKEQELRRQLAILANAGKGATTALQKTILEGRIQDLNDKRTEKDEKKTSTLRATINNANNVISTIDEAIPLVNWNTTGTTGSVFALKQGTEAYVLRQKLITVKANLGFDRLDQMRQSSPTGGALGQVAIQELEALQNSIASLDANQDDKTLLSNLSRVKKHYAAWKDTAEGRISEIAAKQRLKQGLQPLEQQAETPSAVSSSPASPASPGTWSIRKVNN